MTENKENIIHKIFFPYDYKNIEDIKQNDNAYFAHYCSADSAQKIIKSRNIWMRNTRAMNDYEEVLHGLKIINKIWYRESEFWRSIENLIPGVAELTNNIFDKIKTELLHTTFISCFSEHYKDTDGEFGKLSMWRAYGGNNGVALILKKSPFIEGNENYNNLFTSSVCYFCEERIKEELFNIIKGIKNNISFIKQMDTSSVSEYFFRSLLFLTICNKNPAFIEEKEWRAIYLPSLFSNKNIEFETVTINSLPQTIYKIPLYKNLNDNKEGIAFEDILEKVIIGPTAYPLIVAESIAMAMHSIGIEDPYSKIKISNIPLRT